MNAHVLIREQPWYRREAFTSGLKAAGHAVQMRSPDNPNPDTLLVIWNRYAGNHEIALKVERRGGKVIVAENGYLGAGGTSPKFDVHPRGPQPQHYYALALGYHNDDTRSVSGVAARFSTLGLEIKPWRVEGRHILVCPNRAFGPPDRAMHPDWATRCAHRLSSKTQRPIHVRKHPGNDAPKRSVLEDLKGAWACVVWSSSCGVHALLQGIPVFVEGPHWIMREAAATGSVDEPTLVDRAPHFERMAWAQWRIEEIATGAPFRHLLGAA